jgi:hypothetical protein
MKAPPYYLESKVDVARHEVLLVTAYKELSCKLASICSL